MEVLLSDAIIMCPHGGQVNLKNAEASGYGYNNTKAIIYEKLIGAPIAGCSIAGPGLKPCTTIASAVAGMAPTSKGPDGAYCMPFLVCVTDGSPGGPTIVSSPGVQGFGIAPSVAIPAIKAAKAAVENSSALTEAQKEEALAQLAKAQSEAEEEARKEEGKKKKKEPAKFKLNSKRPPVTNAFQFLKIFYAVNPMDIEKEEESRAKAQEKITSVSLTIKNVDTNDKVTFDSMPIKPRVEHVFGWNGTLEDGRTLMPSGLLELNFDIAPSNTEIEATNEDGEEVDKVIRAIYSNNFNFKINTQESPEGLKEYNDTDAVRSILITKKRNDFNSKAFVSTNNLPSLFKIKGTDELHAGSYIVPYRIGDEKLEVLTEGEKEDKTVLTTTIDLKHSFLSKIPLEWFKAHKQRTDFFRSDAVVFFQMLINIYNAALVLKEQLIGTSLNAIQSKYSKIRELILLACDGEYGPATARAFYHFIKNFDEDEESDISKGKTATDDLNEIFKENTNQDIVNDKDEEGNTAQVLWHEAKGDEPKYSYRSKHLSINALKYLFEKTFIYRNFNIYSDQADVDTVISLIKKYASKNHFFPNIEGLEETDFQAFMLAFFFEKSRFIHAQTNGNFLVGSNEAIGYGQIPMAYMKSRSEMPAGEYNDFDFSQTPAGKEFYKLSKEDRAMAILSAEGNIQLTTMILSSYITSDAMNKAFSFFPGNSLMRKLEYAVQVYDYYGIPMNIKPTPELSTEVSETVINIFSGKVYDVERKDEEGEVIENPLAFMEDVRKNGMTWDEASKASFGGNWWVTREQMKAMGVDIEEIKKYHRYLDFTLKYFEINNSKRKAHFFAQLLAESNFLTRNRESLNYSVEALKGKFTYFEDNPEEADLYGYKLHPDSPLQPLSARNYTQEANEEEIGNRAYGNRSDLGNGSIESGDGYRFRGRGLIQLTGKAAYEAFQKVLKKIPGYRNTNIMTDNGVNLVATDDFIAAFSAGWFFSTYKAINSEADKEDGRMYSTVTNDAVDECALLKVSTMVNGHRSQLPNDVYDEARYAVIVKEPNGMIDRAEKFKDTKEAFKLEETDD